MIRNTPIGASNFVALADQDDIWHEQKLARAVSALSESEASGYSCAVTAFWKSGREQTLLQISSQTKLDFLFEGAGQGCTFVLEANLFLRLEKFFRSNEISTRLLTYRDWAISP